MAPDGLSLLFHVFVASQRTRRLLGDAMADGPLTPEGYALYSALLASGPVSTSQLARELGMPVTTVHDQVAELVDRGDVDRRPDPLDGRVQLLVLSPQGRAAHDAARTGFEDAISVLHDALERSPEEVRDALVDLAAACEVAARRLRHRAATA